MLKAYHLRKLSGVIKIMASSAQVLTRLDLGLGYDGQVLNLSRFDMICFVNQKKAKSWYLSFERWAVAGKDRLSKHIETLG